MNDNKTCFQHASKTIKHLCENFNFCKEKFCPTALGAVKEVSATEIRVFKNFF
jgi:hypothetical protein